MFIFDIKAIIKVHSKFMFSTLVEGWYVFRKLTLKKVWNLVLLRTSFYISLLSGRAIHWGKPYAISIEPTTSCNLRCPECISGLRSFSRPTGMLSSEIYKKIIDQSSSYLTYLMLYFQGEPYLNPNFFEFIRYASGKQIYTSTSTNGHFLNDENARETIDSGLDRIIISLDGTDQKSYEKYRLGGSFQKVIEGTKKLVYWKKKMNKKNPYIILQFLIFRSNEHQVADIRELSKALKVDRLLLKTAQINNPDKHSERIPVNPEYSRYTYEKGQYILKNRYYNKCWRMWGSTVITWDGKVVPCCFDKDAKYTLGDITGDDLNKVWRNDRQKKFRQRILNGRQSIDICRNCTNGTRITVD